MAISSCCLGGVLIAAGHSTRLDHLTGQRKSQSHTDGHYTSPRRCYPQKTSVNRHTILMLALLMACIINFLR